MKTILPRANRGILLVMTLFIVAWNSNSCNSQTKVLKFDTLHQSDFSLEYEDEVPGVMVFISASDAKLKEAFFQESAREKLRNNNFDDYLVIAVFSGWSGTGHEGINIEKILNQENEIFIFVSIGGPTGKDTESSPYQLIRIRNFTSNKHLMTFNLVSDNAIVATSTLEISD